LLSLYLAVLDDQSSEEQFIDVYNTYKRLVYHTAYKIMGDSYLAEDVLQEVFLLKQCRIVSAYHLTVDTNGAQIDQSWLFEKDDLTYIDIAKTFEQIYFITDYAGGSGDSGALNELTIAFGETMDGISI